MRSVDAHKMERLKAGDLEVLAEIFDTYAAAVKSYAQKQLQNHIESNELTCDAFTQLYILAHEEPGLVEEHVTFESLFFSMVKGLVKEALRMRKVAWVLEHELAKLPIVDTLQPDEVALKNELWAKVAKAIDELPVYFQLPAKLVFYEQRELKEVARLIRIPLNTMKTHMVQIRKWMRNSLGNYFDGGRP